MIKYKNIPPELFNYGTETYEPNVGDYVAWPANGRSEKKIFSKIHYVYKKEKRIVYTRCIVDGTSEDNIHFIDEYDNPYSGNMTYLAWYRPPKKATVVISG